MLLCTAEIKKIQLLNSWRKVIFNEDFCLFLLMIAYWPINKKPELQYLKHNEETSKSLTI